MNKSKTIIIILGVILIILLAIFLRVNMPQPETQNTKSTTMDAPEQDMRIQTLADGTKYLVHPDKIQSGGPPKDGIPSIDEPTFVSVSKADEWIADNELVLALEYEGVKRVYPLQIMTWHEIVNDKIEGDAILVTYCPLCGSGIAYERTINGEEVEFGTSGKLYNSNLVMYDRKTDTYWTQIGGQAIIGELTGMTLELIDMDTVTWGEWKKAHPDSEVLSKDTGFDRQYGSDPYANYFEDSFLMFPVENQDDRISNKEVIFGIEIGGEFKAYRETDIESEQIITDEFEGVPIKIEKKKSGAVEITRTDTEETIPKERDFWFAWYAFHPNTQLYGFEENNQA